MAASYIVCRSNAFRVTDDKRFARWCSFFGLEHWTNPPDKDGNLFHNIGQDDGEGWPNYHPATGNDDFDFEDELRKHLHPDTIAILSTVSHKGLALAAYAVALHADGRSIAHTLSYITDMARHEFGEGVTIMEASF